MNVARRSDAMGFAKSWVNAWNQRNLDVVLAHYRHDL